MTLNEFIREMDRLYPRALSAAWDTDGLQCSPDPDREIRRVLVALDGGEREIDLAVSGGYDLLLTHHPMIFGKAGDVVPYRLNGRKLIKLISAGVSAASFHTRLDAGKDGVNDCLAKTMGFVKTEVFGDDECPALGRIATLDVPVSAEDFCRTVKEKLNCPAVKLTGEGMIRCIAIVGGAGKDFIMPAKSAGADAILTGEVSYNSAIDAAEMGISVIEAGHYHTEFPVCERLRRIAEEFTGAEVDVADLSDKAKII